MKNKKKVVFSILTGLLAMAVSSCGIDLSGSKIGGKIPDGKGGFIEVTVQK